jgi:hypothetical protein
VCMTGLRRNDRLPSMPSRSTIGIAAGALSTLDKVTPILYISHKKPVPGSVMVAQKTLDLFVGVRILPGKATEASQVTDLRPKGPLRLSVRT